MNNKIRSFREDPALWEKIVMALAYLVLGWVVATRRIEQVDGLLTIFMLLGILAWVFIVRKRSIKYFVRFHTVQAILLNLVLAVILWLYSALLGLFLAIPGLEIIARLLGGITLSPLGNMIPGPIYSFPLSQQILDASLLTIALMSIAVVLAVYCLRGKYTELPWITDGVRNWM